MILVKRGGMETDVEQVDPFPQQIEIGLEADSIVPKGILLDPLQGKTGQIGIASRHRRAENGHPQAVSQIGEMIGAKGALHLLKGDDIRGALVDDAQNPFRIDPAVSPPALPHIESHHTDGVHILLPEP